MHSDIAISVKNLTKTYRIFSHPGDRIKQALSFGKLRFCQEFTALQDVSFEIKKGEAVGIIGRNGSGKSTLLQLICGILKPTSGEVDVNGRISALLELGSGFSPEFTGRENVFMNATVLGLSRQEIEARFADIEAFADIGAFIDQQVRTYSSGMMLRLAFAVIAHVDADILVIDEALSVGDAFFVQKCMRFLRKFMEKGTVLFVSHDIGVVLNLCKKAVWVQKGEIESAGQPKEVTERYLENLYESQQGKGIGHAFGIAERTESRPKPARYMRLDFFNQTKFRNDIELFCFSPDTQSFGLGGVEIAEVKILDQAGRSLAWVVGGEPVQMMIQCRAQKNIVSPIVGFMVKDRLGQVVFADNTFLAYAQRTLCISSGERFQASFAFSMPIMPLGDYTISVAVAEGTQADHVQHQWIHEAIAFKVHSSSVCHGLLGVPMEKIELKII